jgi:hypothetical protein
VAGLTPLECFLAGVAVVSLCLNQLLFFLFRSVAKQRRHLPDSSPLGLEGTPPEDRTVADLRDRLREVEKRVSALERRTRDEVTA